MQGFYWLIEGILAGCSRPGHTVQRDASPSVVEQQLDSDLAWLRGQGIRAVLSLTETPLVETVLAQHDLPWLHLPVADLHAPTAAQFDASLAFIDEQRVLDHPTVVHCLVGQGRTGTILTAYLIRTGMTVEAALAQVRAVCPGAVGSADQVQALHAFAKRRDLVV